MGDLKLTSASGSVTLSPENVAGTTTITLPSSTATLATNENFTSTGIDDNATSTAITIDSSENVSIDTGNLVIGTSGKGIDFSATANTTATGASMTSELLDDYEEGTWTPVVKQGGCSVTTVHKAVYVKIGKSVTVTTYLTIGSGGTGTRFELEGLPFNSESYGYACGSADGGTGNGVSIVRTQSNSDYLRFKRVASPNDWAVGSDMDNEHLIFALTYFT